MMDLVQARHKLSLTYDIAASDLDESIVPLMVAVNRMSEELTKSFNTYELQAKNIERLLTQKAPQIYCDKPKTALLVGIGKYGSISLAISIFLSVFWLGLIVLKINESKYLHLESLAKIVQCDSKTGTYFVKKSDFMRSKEGIILKIK